MARHVQQRPRRRLVLATSSAYRRYGPWASLVAGAVTAVLWREGVDGIRAAFVLASLAGVVSLLVLFPPWTSDGAAWARTAAWFTAANLAQNALWFVIPFYVLSTTWLSWNAPFTMLLVALGVLSCFDSYLRDRVLRGGAAAVAFVTPALLAALQLFLPIVSGVPPRFTVFASGALAALTGALFVGTPGSGGGAAARAARVIAVAAGGAALAWLTLPLLAPAPIRIASASFALGRDGLDPVGPVEAVAPGPAFVFIAVEAPRGLRETVRLEIDDAGSRESRPLEIVGGREGGYRLWAPVHGEATHEVRATIRTEGGQIVGRVTAPVTAVAAPASVAAPSP